MSQDSVCMHKILELLFKNQFKFDSNFILYQEIFQRIIYFERLYINDATLQFSLSELLFQP